MKGRKIYYGNKATTCPPVGVGTASGVASALNYLTMSDKDFKKWLAKKPIWERPTYIANRIVFQAKLKEEQAKPKPNGGSGQDTTTGKGGGSTSNNNVKPKCPEKDKNDTSVVTIIDCTKETANIINSIISNHGTIDV